ncbi:copper-resistant cuproprotein CopI [Vibrio mediterranei]|uniref:copper-resistant cuproprotein CopI n=1 Tax=Vibrio mediterranei TaxID=689 RepID=UPI00406855F7
MKKSLITLALIIASSNVMADSSGHAHMDHSNMNHETMDHSKMDHSNMMDMEGMSAVGMPATGAKPDKVVHVILSDDMKIAFKRDVTIEPNDVVQFVVMNTGKMDHEFSIGSIAEQLEHREMMKSMPAGHDHHGMGNVVHLKPGKAGQLLWHFHGEKEVEFACNIPGHAEAGMTKTINLK